MEDFLEANLVGCTVDDLRRKRFLTRARYLAGLLLRYRRPWRRKTVCDEADDLLHDAASTRCHAAPLRGGSPGIFSLVSLWPSRQIRWFPRLAVFIPGREAFSKRPRRTRPFANCSPNALTIPAAGSPVTLCLHGFDSRMGMRHVPRVWREAASIPATRGGASIGGRVVARGFQVSSFFSFSFVSFRLPFPPSSSFPFSPFFSL